MMDESNLQWEKNQTEPNRIDLVGLNDERLWATVRGPYTKPDGFLWSCGTFITAGREDGVADTLEEAQEVAQRLLLRDGGVW